MSDAAGRSSSPGGTHDSLRTQSEPLPDWERLRLSLNNALAELLAGWGLLAAFRRRGGGAGAARASSSSSPVSPSVVERRRRPYRSPRAAQRGRSPPEAIEMSQFSYRVAQSSPVSVPVPTTCRPPPETIVCGTADRRQHESDADSGVCLDRDSTASSGVLLWEEFDGTGSGEGHSFSRAQLRQPSWCDYCGDLLWNHVVTCKYCSYTCHQRCRDLVTLDCPSDLSSDLDLSEVTDPSQDEELVEVQTIAGCASVAGVREIDSSARAVMIEKFNATAQGLYMTLSEDGGSFHGFVRVHMYLFRPINIVAGARPPSIYDVLQPDRAGSATLERTLASFYLPRDTVKALHIHNDTTVHEVIASLLNKFKIVDDPRKFALYERYTEHGETSKAKMRRLADSERPLELALAWSHNGVVNKKFVLQENDTGDILWDNFTLPELNNFLLMLNREEEDYKRRVRQKYTEMRRRISEQMARIRPPDNT